MALYDFFEHVSRRDNPDSPGSKLCDGFTDEERQVFDRLFHKAYTYCTEQFNDPYTNPSREARDRFCHRFLPNLCGYEPTEDNPNPTPPPALNRLDIEERLKDCQYFDNCYFYGCPRRHAPQGPQEDRNITRPSSSELCVDDMFPPRPKHTLRGRDYWRLIVFLCFWEAVPIWLGMLTG